MYTVNSKERSVQECTQHNTSYQFCLIAGDIYAQHLIGSTPNCCGFVASINNS